MKTIIFLISFWTTCDALAVPKLSFSGSYPAQFTFEITNQGLGLDIIESKNSRRTQIKPKFTISDANKIFITPQKKDRLQQKLELLLVVLSKGAQVQMVQVYIPTSDEKLIQSSQTETVCEFENFGDFSWEKPAELGQKIRLIKKGNQTQLELKIGHLTNQAQIASVQQLWKKCFSF